MTVQDLFARNDCCKYTQEIEMNEILEFMAGDFIMWKFGLVLTVLWPTVWLLTWGWHWLWAYIDDFDGKEDIRNIWIEKIAGFFGYEKFKDSEPKVWFYIKKGAHQYDCGVKTRGQQFFFFPFLVIWLFVLSVVFWEISLVFAAIYITIKTARSVRRLNKKFSKHESDPDAHKVENE